MDGEEESPSLVPPSGSVVFGRHRVHIAEPTEEPCESTEQEVAAARKFSRKPSTRDGPKKVVRCLTEEVGGLVHASTSGVKWQWEHRTGFKDYDERTVAMIEKAFQRGRSHIRVKAGKNREAVELFLVDLVQYDPKTGNARRIRRVGRISWWHGLWRRANELIRILETGRDERMMYAKYEQSHLERRRTMGTPEYNVANFYHPRGCCVAIARSNSFTAVSLLAVLLSVVWIGYDSDTNNAVIILEADAFHQAVEQLFCAWFFMEFFVRFFAFKSKWSCLKDYWFLFDALLLFVSVLNAWIVPLIMVIAALGEEQHEQLRTTLGSVGSAMPITALRAVRVLKILRLGRVVQLLRIVPEVQTIVKAVVASLRAVVYTMVLELVLMYVFALAFRLLAADFADLESVFGTVPNAMWTLMFQGILLDNPTNLCHQVGADSQALAGLFVFYMFLSNSVLLNMVIGILADCVQFVAVNEKEQAAVSFLKTELLELLECHDKNNDRLIHTDEFDLLMRNPEMHFVLKRFGVNANDLIQLKEVLFATKAKENPETDSDSGSDSAKEAPKLSFAEFLEVVLRLRGNNKASVLDIVDFREYIRTRMDRVEARIGEAAVLRRRSRRCDTTGSRPQEAPQHTEGEALKPGDEEGSYVPDVDPCLLPGQLAAVKNPSDYALPISPDSSDVHERPSLLSQLSESDKLSSQLFELSDFQDQLLEDQDSFWRDFEQKQALLHQEVGEVREHCLHLYSAFELAERVMTPSRGLRSALTSFGLTPPLPPSTSPERKVSEESC